MGLLVDGRWQDKWYDTKESGGRFVRQESHFRDWVKRDGSTQFSPELGRYVLYVSYACPWANRTLIFRRIKGLDSVIELAVVHPLMREHGWTFSTERGATGDPVLGKTYLHEVYTTANPSYTGRVTVPILWDKRTDTIVNNESSELIRMLNSEFNDFGDATLDFYPTDIRSEIDRLNEQIYHHINNGVYRAGFATTQSAYEEAVGELFSALDELEKRLRGAGPFLFGDRITEADWRLFTTLVRFDAVYVGHFKCNLRRLVDYPHLAAYTRKLYEYPGVADTVNFDHIKFHYYASHLSLNPSGVVPMGPVEDFRGAL